MLKIPSRATVDAIRAQYPVGTRVRLLAMEDTQAPPIGTMGTIRGVDDMGSVMVAWDNGCGLSVCLDAGDRIEVME